MSATPTGAGPDWRIPSDDCKVTIEAKITIAGPPSEAEHKWKPTNEDRIRPEHAARWPRSPWTWPYRLPDLERLNAEQREEWQAFVRGRQLSKRLKRAQRTTAPDWHHNLRCVVLELQRDRAAVPLTSGCRCPACRTDVRTVVDIGGWPDFNLTRGPRRLTRAQRKAATAGRLRRKSTP